MLICRCSLTLAAVAAASRNVGVVCEWSLTVDPADYSSIFPQTRPGGRRFTAPRVFPRRRKFVAPLGEASYTRQAGVIRWAFAG